MLEFKGIDIKDKALFDSYLQRYNPEVSELTFTNLFMWRNYYKVSFTVAGGMLCIISAPEETEPFAFVPIGQRGGEGFREAVGLLKEYFSGKGWRLVFKRVSQSELEYFKGLNAGNEDFRYDRDNSDYVYLSESLVKLGGKKYDGKRNHINKFKKLYSYEYVRISEKYIDDCCRIMEDWCAERSCEEHKGLYCEKKANLELLKHFRELGCKGALIKVDGRFEAFTVGEMLNSDTAVIHIEKANSRINGLYTFINQQFCENEWQKALYINREQDLGKEGLRKAKLSYNPVKLIDKYTVVV